MSELKVHNINDLSLHDIVNCDFYLKSEADKVIAEKDAEIAELKEQIEVLKHQACKMDCMTVKLYNEACNDIIYHKYKRCLAMAMWCDSEANYWYDSSKVQQCWRYGHYISWFNKWSKLAEKFKEAK